MATITAATASNDAAAAYQRLRGHLACLGLKAAPMRCPACSTTPATAACRCWTPSSG